MFKQIIKTYFPILPFNMTALAAGQSTRERADAATGQGRLTQLASDWPLSAQTGLWLADGVLSALDTVAPVCRLMSDLPHMYYHVTRGHLQHFLLHVMTSTGHFLDTPPWWGQLETEFHQNFKLWDNVVHLDQTRVHINDQGLNYKS